MRGRPEENTIRPFSYHIEPPFQQSQHVTMKADATWDVAQRHSLIFSLSFQENLRQEFENRKTEDKAEPLGDRKSTRLNSSHANISYAVFCLKKKKKNEHLTVRCVTFRH